MTAPKFSRAEYDIFERFEMAEHPPEVLRERVAIAIHDADKVGNYPFFAWLDDSEENREDYRLLADAAISEFLR